MKRRTFLTTGLAASLLPDHQAIPQGNTQAKRAIRIAHITDIHISPGNRSAQGFAKALQFINSLSDKPELILNGGDCILDALETDKADVKAQWQLWHSVLRQENNIPVMSAIGNHDVFGWFMPNDTLKNDPLYGKKWALDELGMSERYYSFDRQGWHFIVLDSIYQTPNPADPELGLAGRLDDQQMTWLAKDLASTNRPICILSHIPILSACYQFFRFETRAGNQIPASLLTHTDSLQLKDLFKQHPQIKLCISGHLHMQEELTYLGIKYLCNGSIAGRRWIGPFQEFEPIVTILDLYEDGRTQHYWYDYTKAPH
ncbi:metallophosphoesterase family protein [Spirosoma litoris]